MLRLVSPAVLPILMCTVAVLAPVGIAQAADSADGVECDGVAWPADYVPAEDPIRLPSAELGLRGALAFPDTRLPYLDPEELIAEDEFNSAFNERKPLRMGIQRELPFAVSGSWTTLDDGSRLWTAAVASDGATALRLHFVDVDLPPGAALYVYGAEDPDLAAGQYAGTGPQRSGEFWSRSVPGAVARIEYHVPADQPVELPFAVSELAHVYRPMFTTSGGGLRAPLDCMIDVACNPDWPTWEDVSRSVANISWIDDGGGVGGCSGTLLAAQNNDLTPYFLTSAHCIDSVTEAATAEFRWFHQRATCGGGLMSSQFSSDASLLGTSGESVGADWTLLMVDGVLPNNVFWAGWTTNIPASGAASVGLHHPSGIEKKWSRGPRFSGPFSNYHEIRYASEGNIYFGSSGSAIWRESDQRVFGNASFISGSGVGCDFPYPQSATYYGRFSNYYGNIAGLLAAGADDAFEDNDSCANAVSLESGGYTNLAVKSLDEDWYRVVLGVGGQLNLNLTFTDAHGNINAQLYTSCGGSLVASATSSTNNETLIYNNPGATEDFYLRIYLADDTRNEYDMSVGGTSIDCNLSGLDDACDVDCGLPGCNVPGCGLSDDCNGNLTPDECELDGNDCNGNGVPDECDEAALITAHPADEAHCAGGTANFSVTAPGATGYQWLKDGLPLSNGGGVSGATTPNLTVSGVDDADEGAYVAQVSQGCIIVLSDPATLTVPEQPAITSQPVTVNTRCAGNTAVFSVTATGQLLMYEWRKDGVPLVNGGRISGADTASLSISDVQYDDAGDYNVFISNICGNVTSNLGELRIASPEFTEDPQDACAEVGGTAVFSSSATSPLSITYTWRKNGNPISDQAGHISGSATSTLTITNAVPSDAGDYHVIAFTTSPLCFTDSATATLTIGGCATCATPGDMDGDGDYDLADMQEFTQCFDANVTSETGCVCANVDDGDQVVDLNDWSALSQLLTGPQ